MRLLNSERTGMHCRYLTLHMKYMLFDDELLFVLPIVSDHLAIYLQFLIFFASGVELRSRNSKEIERPCFFFNFWKLNIVSFSIMLSFALERGSDLHRFLARIVLMMQRVSSVCLRSSKSNQYLDDGRPLKYRRRIASSIAR